jgi:8-oxo-dGTP pyrophosphatase MutT (NUDIX family)
MSSNDPLPANDPRSLLLNQLQHYVAADENDSSQADRLRAFVAATPDCFRRENQAGHITGSAWLVDETGHRVLLTHHKKLNKWLQLGGHADGEPDVRAVAMREAQEESGLTDVRIVSPDIFDVDVHPIPERPQEPAHLHYDVRFALQARGSKDVIVGPESHNLAWIPISDLPALTQEESLLRMARKWARFRSVFVGAS